MKKRIKQVVGAAAAALVCAVGIYAYLHLGGGAGERDKGAAQAVARPAVPVVLTPAAMRPFEDGLVVQGNVESQHFALVCPLIDGTITELYVGEGDAVVAHETKLFQIDRVKVSQAVEISRQDLAVARCGKREAEANLKSLEAQFEKADIDYRRFQRLREQDAVTLDAMEQQTARYKATKAGLEHAQTLIALAAEREKQAEAALVIAEKNLKDSLVHAPISGRVTHKMKEQGEFGSAGHPALRIADVSALEVSAFLPAEYYSRVHEGETHVRLSVPGTDAGTHRLSYKSPAIEPSLRSFEVKCRVTDPPDGLVPGAIAQLDVLLEARDGLGVAAEAVQLRAAQQVVFVVENGTAKMVAVETGLHTGGWVELLGDAVAEGQAVVTMGQLLIEDGTPVTVQAEGS